MALELEDNTAEGSSPGMPGATAAAHPAEALETVLDYLWTGHAEADAARMAAEQGAPAEPAADQPAAVRQDDPLHSVLANYSKWLDSSVGNE